MNPASGDMEYGSLSTIIRRAIKLLASELLEPFLDGKIVQSGRSLSMLFRDRVIFRLLLLQTRPAEGIL